MLAKLSYLVCLQILILQKYMKDNYFSWQMQNDGSYRKNEKNHNVIRSQFDITEDMEKS